MSLLAEFVSVLKLFGLSKQQTTASKRLISGERLRVAITFARYRLAKLARRARVLASLLALDRQRANQTLGRTLGVRDLNLQSCWL